MFHSSLSLFTLLLLFPLPSSPHNNVSSHPPPTSKNLIPANDMLPFEAETLFSIMDSMSSDQNWRYSYPTPCRPGSTWLGIECKLGPDNHLHVSRLDFGTYPNPTCKNTASFPYQIFSLPFVESVFFYNCFTHTKTTLSVSPNRLFNSTLQQLSLRSNPALIGSIPAQISLLKSLQIITLSQNRLTGMIPVGIFTLSALVHLDLSYNLLTGAVPFRLGNLKNLVVLDLSYNSLTGTIPSTIGQLGMLQKLDLSSNSLVGRIPDTIDKLSALSFVALSNNQLRGDFPPGLSWLRNLEYFIMDDNPMYIPLPADFGKLEKLKELRLANSGYSGTIPPGFSLLMNLTTLSLQNNRLTGEIPSAFSSLSHIYHLNLSRNFLEGVVPFNASFLNRLGKNLDLSGNPGLCLSPSEPYNVKIGVGVGVCGTNKSGSLAARSQAPLVVPGTHMEFVSSILLIIFLS